MKYRYHNLEEYFFPYRKNIIGIDKKILTIYGEKAMVYADWTASGRNYSPIEQCLINDFMPYVANTHSEASTTGMIMTYAYEEARNIIKKHVNANDNDLIITAGSGMTKVVNKLQRILNLRINERYPSLIDETMRPVVFVSHMEHHSNHTSWLETIATVEVIQPINEGEIDLQHLKALLNQYKNRPLKIASVTACSNVTGITTPYHEIAKIMHQQGGYCFVDFACSAPYVPIDMHPAEDPEKSLDAIFFSPHKFLGGPGSTGVLIFNKKLYHRSFPDDPGGGTVDWTNPWGGHKYVDDIEAREDGGTPAFLQTIKAALCIKLKEEMGSDQMMQREHELTEMLWHEIESAPGIHILAPNHKNRLAVISFYIEGLHYNLGVRLLNDLYGIQTRGGCSCAGTYGHYLLHVDKEESKKITDSIDQGDFSSKPGWIRISLHPTMTEEEISYIGKSVKEMATHFRRWENDYLFDKKCGCYHPVNKKAEEFYKQYIHRCFMQSLS